MKTLYRMRPERYRYLTPFGQNGWVMAFRFRESTNAMSEAQGFCKIAETKLAFESQDGLPLYQSPLRNLMPQFLNFPRSYLRRISPACGTSLVSKYSHTLSPIVWLASHLEGAILIAEIAN